MPRLDLAIDRSSFGGRSRWPRWPRWMRGGGAIALGLAALLGSARVEAQPESIPRFDFSFSNPGARSLGFGGAFAALADDATAAYANPAGLVQLSEPEVSLEGRYWRRTPTFLAGGRFEGEATGRGIDTRDHIVFGHDASSSFGPSFAAVVLPKGRWSFAVYGHQLAKFEEHAESQGFFFDGDEDPFGINRSPGTRERVSMDVVSGGLAAAWRMNDRLSFGVDVVVSSLSLKTHSDAFLPDDDSEDAAFGEIHFLPARRLTSERLEAHGSDVTFNAGVLGRITDQLSAGLFYRQGATVDGRLEIETGPAFPFDGAVRTTATFGVPNVAGGGLAFHSRDGAVTISTEADRVEYHRVVELRSSDEIEVIGRSFFDAWEYHLGAEYALLRSTPLLAFRAGYWLEANGDDLLDRRFSHISAGLGLVVKALQLDLAADFSNPGDTLSLSCIYTF